MRTKVETWTIKKLLDAEASIELTPAYQRGPAWDSDKQALLIDSVFRGYDLPKLYLALKSGLGAGNYEVIDGQQRVRAISQFAAGAFGISPQSLGRTAGERGVKHSDLRPNELEQFENFELTVAVISGADPLFKRTLFARLQLGERLNPAELRNALQSSTPLELRSIATMHGFFKVAGIKNNRYRREDYLTHVFALLEFGEDDWRDIKAPRLRDFVLSRSRGLNKEDRKIGDSVLTFLEIVARHAQKAFQNKWSFVDAFMFCSRRSEALTSSKALAVARSLKRIEELRKEHYKRPELLLATGCRVPHSQELHDYINAYKTAGAVRENIEARSVYLEKVVNI